MAKKAKALWLIAAAVTLAGIAIWPVMHWGEAARWADAQDRGFDEHAASTDLQADIALMWQTAPMRTQPESEASTLDAILAASRVFNTVTLTGKTGAEVKALLGSPLHSSESIYRASPFWPLEARGMVYRFDCGTCGWQFDVHCEGDDRPVTDVVRRWIH